jgi:catechol 2,3-dioxygenase-like lactoylglutathione lyase family enzyme
LSAPVSGLLAAAADYICLVQVVPMIQVADIGASSQWYQTTLGLVSGHGGDEFEMLFAGEPFATPLLLQLHRWDAHEHGFLGSPDQPVGNGSSLWFQVADRAEFDVAWSRAESLSEVLSQPSWNPLAHHHEFSLRDPDGYVVAVHTPFSAEAD